MTTASAVPSQLQALAREILALHTPEEVATGTAPCASLKQVLSGGEALTITMAQDISAAIPRSKLYNTYGGLSTGHMACVLQAIKHFIGPASANGGLLVWGCTLFSNCSSSSCGTTACYHTFNNALTLRRVWRVPMMPRYVTPMVILPPPKAPQRQL